VITFVCEEGSEVGCRMRSVVIGELHKGQKVIPVVLVIVDVDPQVLLQDLIEVLHLTVSLRVISGREVLLDVEKMAERGPEVGHECLAAVGYDVGRRTMLGEDMAQIQLSKVFRCISGSSGDEQSHLGEAADDDEDRVVS